MLCGCVRPSKCCVYQLCVFVCVFGVVVPWPLLPGPFYRYAFSTPDHAQPGLELISVRSSTVAAEDLARRGAVRRERVAAAVSSVLAMHGVLGRTRPMACIAAARMWNDAQSRVAGEVALPALGLNQC